jgi:hypothetical protein
VWLFLFLKFLVLENDSPILYVFVLQSVELTSEALEFLKSTFFMYDMDNVWIKPFFLILFNNYEKRLLSGYTFSLFVFLFYLLDYLHRLIMLALWKILYLLFTP